MKPIILSKGYKLGWADMGKGRYDMICVRGYTENQESPSIRSFQKN